VLLLKKKKKKKKKKTKSTVYNCHNFFRGCCCCFLPSPTMGAKQSTPAFDPGRTRAYSSSDLPSGGHANAVSDGGIAGLRYTNGPDGPRIRYTGGGGGGSSGGGSSGGVGGLDIPSGGRSGSHARINQSLEEEEEEDDGEEEGGDLTLPAAGGHRLRIGSLPAHLSPRMLGGKVDHHGIWQ